MARFEFDAAKESLTLEEAGRRCGRPIEVRGGGTQVRIDCPFSCAGDHVGKKEISVSLGHPAKPWRCHSYECQARGDIVHLIHGLLAGVKPPAKIGGRDFLNAKKVILGEGIQPQPQRPDDTSAPPAIATPAENRPLEESDNEKVRELVGLELKLITDPEAMNPVASRWWRMRPYLTPEICARWGVGFMPLDGGGDKRGWSLRGQIVYRFLSEDDKVLCYVGRDPDYENKLRNYEAIKPEFRDPKKAPAKYHFPKNAFSRGLELYGQHASRIDFRPEHEKSLADYGLILVEGFNDVLALDRHEVYGEAICSNQFADQQLSKIVDRARRLASGRVSLLFDADEAGDNGARATAWELLQAGLDVRLGWSRAMFEGKYNGKQPEHLSAAILREHVLPKLRR